MSFKSLYKLFVMNDQSTFSKIYSERINSESVIKFDIYINNNQAFFFYDKNVMNLIAGIRELDYKINKLFSLLPPIAISQYMRKSLIDEIEFTNKIEGVVSTRKDIHDLINEIEKHTIIKNRFEGIVNKYVLLTEEELDFKESLDIRKLYNEMLYHEIEEEDINNLPDGIIFRKNPVHVYKTSEKVVHNGVMPEDKIIDYINKSLSILNDTSLDVLIRVSIFHYLFGYIHPFYDGNGRINRFISSYVISRYFNRIVGFRLSMTIKENLSQYLDAFNQTNDVRNKGDITTFVYEFLDIIYKSYQKTEIYALEKKQEFEYYNNFLNSSTSLNKNEFSLLYILVQCSIFGDFGLSKSQLMKIAKKGNTTVTQLLGNLKKVGLCEEIKSGRYVYYKANLDEVENLK